MAATTAAVASVEPSSTTITSSTGTVWLSVEPTAERTVVAALKAGMTTDRRSLVMRASSGLEASNVRGRAASGA